MGSALLGGLLARGLGPGRRSGRRGARAGRRASGWPSAHPGAGAGRVRAPAGARADGAVLAVKPDVAEGACRALGAVGVQPGAVHRGRAFAARLEAALGPGAVGRAGHAQHAGPGRGRGDRHLRRLPAATSADLDWAEGDPRPVGTVVRLPERLLDAVTGLSGSGPAYVFLVAEALIEAGVPMGLARDVSRTLVVETMLGSARLLAETGRRPGGPAGRGDLAGRHHRGGVAHPRGQGRALRLHGGGGGRHRAIAQLQRLSHAGP